jgi:hypothetical protein
MSKRKAVLDAAIEGIVKEPRVSKPVQRFDAGQGSTTATEKATKISTSRILISPEKQPIPNRNTLGNLVFVDHPEFSPNLTPQEVMQAGSFGGTYFRPIKSGVTGLSYKEEWKEFPMEWFAGLDINRQVASSVYNNNVNSYKINCGGDLAMWESSGWITASDPYGWFQWYCRFYLGRRCSDDERQISRGNGVISSTGRWRNNLVNKCLSSGAPLDKVLGDTKISPKVRQLLQHWGYRLTLKDLEAGKKRAAAKTT